MSLLFDLFNKFPVATTDPGTISMGGNGVYSAEEWARVRGATDSLFLKPTEVNYRRSTYPELSKLSSAYNLCRLYDFTQFKRLGDIGGCPFYQATVIFDLNPHLDGLLSDLDRASCELLKVLPRFENYRIIAFDVKSEDLSAFDSCDVLTMWAVDYALDDVDIIQIFKYVNANSKTLLLASIECERLSLVIRNLIPYVVVTTAKRLFGREYKTRMHGMLRTERYFKRLAEISDVKIRTVLSDGKYRIFEVS